MITAIPEIIVGLAIAAALIPPPDVRGIGIGLGSLDMALSAIFIMASNIFGLVMGFMLIFLIKHVWPRMHHEKKKGKGIVRTNIVIPADLAILLASIELIFM